MKASVTRPWSAPPPTSRKFAGIRAVELDDVHGGHGEAGAIDHAADGAVELHIRELMLGGFDLGGVLLIEIAELGDIRMTEQRVVVEGHLGIQALDCPPPLRQRIDLDQSRIVSTKTL